MRRALINKVVPVALVLLAGLARAQDSDEKPEKWQIWFSETLGVSFLALGTPVTESVEFQGPLADKIEKCIGVAFNSGQAELSVYRLVLKPGIKLLPSELVDLRTAIPKEKAPDFKVRENQEWTDSDYPCVQTWVEYSGPDGDLVSRRFLAISCDKGTWLIEANGLTTTEAREAANRFFDSVRMDAASKIKPGTKKEKPAVRFAAHEPCQPSPWPTAQAWDTTCH